MKNNLDKYQKQKVEKEEYKNTPFSTKVKKEDIKMVKIDNKIHEELKYQALREKTTMKELVDKAVKKYLKGLN